MNENSPKIVFRDSAGHVLTEDDLKHATGDVTYELVGGEDVPGEAMSLHQQGRNAGGRGEYAEALAFFEKAAALAPRWPYPVYDAAYTCLLLDNDEKALEYYRKTVELAPRGFFTAITALNTLERERAGELPKGTYLAYLQLENVPVSSRKAILNQLVSTVPAFAPAWKDYAPLLDTPDEQMAAIEKGLAANPDGESKGILMINKALLLSAACERDAAIQILGGLAVDPTSTLGTEALAKTTLAHFIDAGTKR